MLFRGIPHGAGIGVVGEVHCGAGNRLTTAAAVLILTMDQPVERIVAGDGAAVLGWARRGAHIVAQLHLRDVAPAIEMRVCVASPVLSCLITQPSELGCHVVVTAPNLLAGSL